MPAESTRQALLLGLIILALAVMGTAMIVGLVAAWRRQHQRQRRKDRQATPRPDAWQVAGQRLADDSPPPEDEAGGPGGANGEPDGNGAGGGNGAGDDDANDPGDQGPGEKGDHGPTQRS